MGRLRRHEIRQERAFQGMRKAWFGTWGDYHRYIGRASTDLAFSRGREGRPKSNAEAQRTQRARRLWWFRMSCVESEGDGDLAGTWLRRTWSWSGGAAERLFGLGAVVDVEEFEGAEDGFFAATRTTVRFAVGWHGGARDNAERISVSLFDDLGGDGAVRKFKIAFWASQHPTGHISA